MEGSGNLELHNAWKVPETWNYIMHGRFQKHWNLHEPSGSITNDYVEMT
jgi:hypothetical protein